MKDDPIKGAAVALSDLNTFAIVVSILEGGHLHANSYPGAQRIIEICQREQQKRLREYDAAVAKVTAIAHGVKVHPRVAAIRHAVAPTDEGL